MKVKQFSQKLSLNKETVANLSVDEMTNLKGGLRWTEGCVSGIVCQDSRYCTSTIYSELGDCTLDLPCQ